MGVLATGNTDHHAVTGLNHVEVSNGFTRLPAQPLPQLIKLKSTLAGIPALGGVCLRAIWLQCHAVCHVEPLSGVWIL